MVEVLDDKPNDLLDYDATPLKMSMVGGNVTLPGLQSRLVYGVRDAQALLDQGIQNRTCPDPMAPHLHGHTIVTIILTQSRRMEVSVQPRASAGSDAQQRLRRMSSMAAQEMPRRRRSSHTASFAVPGTLPPAAPAAARRGRGSGMEFEGYGAGHRRPSILGMDPVGRASGGTGSNSAELIKSVITLVCRGSHAFMDPMHAMGICEKCAIFIS